MFHRNLCNYFLRKSPCQHFPLRGKSINLLSQASTHLFIKETKKKNYIPCYIYIYTKCIGKVWYGLLYEEIYLHI